MQKSDITRPHSRSMKNICKYHPLWSSAPKNLCETREEKKRFDKNNTRSWWNLNCVKCAYAVPRTHTNTISWMYYEKKNRFRKREAKAVKTKWTTDKKAIVWEMISRTTSTQSNVQKYIFFFSRNNTSTYNNRKRYTIKHQTSKIKRKKDNQKTARERARATRFERWCWWDGMRIASHTQTSQSFENEKRMGKKATNRKKMDNEKYNNNKMKKRGEVKTERSLAFAQSRQTAKTIIKLLLLMKRNRYWLLVCAVRSSNSKLI